MALVVIGGVAAGMSAAARARRLDPQLPIVVLEKGPAVSYGACGLPYLLEGRVREAADLIVHTPEYFRKERKIDVRTGARVVAISHPRREVVLESGERIKYDRLIIATGARCDTSAIAGASQPHVFTLHTLDDAERLRAFLRDREPRRARHHSSPRRENLEKIASRLRSDLTSKVRGAGMFRRRRNTVSAYLSWHSSIVSGRGNNSSMGNRTRASDSAFTALSSVAITTLMRSRRMMASSAST